MLCKSCITNILVLPKHFILPGYFKKSNAIMFTYKRVCISNNIFKLLFVVSYYRYDNPGRLCRYNVCESFLFLFFTAHISNSNGNNKLGSTSCIIYMYVGSTQTGQLWLRFISILIIYYYLYCRRVHFKRLSKYFKLP